MLSFFDYINLNEGRSVKKAKIVYDCERDLEDIILNYARYIDYGVMDKEKENEFYSKFNSNLKKCMHYYVKGAYSLMLHGGILDMDDLINKTLFRVWNTIPEMIEKGETNYSLIIGLIKTMIKREITDMIRRMNAKKRKMQSRLDTIGTESEPRSLSGDPSIENIDIEDILKTPNLTDKEKFVLRKRWAGVSNQDVASELGTVPSYPVGLYKTAIAKVKDYFDFM